MSKAAVSKFDMVINKLNNDKIIKTKLYDVDIEIKKSLTFKEMIKFVNAVVDNCFDVDTCQYIPEAKTFAIRSTFIKMYTNIYLPSDYNKQYEFIRVIWNDFINVAYACIDVNQFDDIINAIDEKIDNRIDLNIDGVNKFIKESYRTIESLSDKINELFSGVNSGDITNLFNVMLEGNGKLDESKIVDMIVNREENKDGKNK